MTSDRFTVLLTNQADKDLRQLRPWVKQATQAILELEKDPWKGHPLKGSLRGVRSLKFSLPGGEYRATYVIQEDEQVCLVFMVGPHESFYKKAERRV